MQVVLKCCCDVSVLKGMDQFTVSISKKVIYNHIYVIKLL